MVRLLKKQSQKLCSKDCGSIACYFECVFGTILIFLWKAVGFVAEHTWDWFAFVAGLIGLWLMQKAWK